MEAAENQITSKINLEYQFRLGRMVYTSRVSGSDLREVIGTLRENVLAVGYRPPRWWEWRRWGEAPLPGGPTEDA